MFTTSTQFTPKGLTLRQVHKDYILNSSEHTPPPFNNTDKVYKQIDQFADQFKEYGGFWCVDGKDKMSHLGEKVLTLKDFLNTNSPFPKDWNKKIATQVGEKGDRPHPVYCETKKYKGMISLKGTDKTKSLPCSLCEESMPTKQMTWCRVCDWSLCGNCYQECIKHKAPHERFDSICYHDSDRKGQPPCPQCRGEGTFSLKGSKGSVLYTVGQVQLPIDYFTEGGVDVTLKKMCSEYVTKWNAGMKIIKDVLKWNEQVAQRNLRTIAHDTEYQGWVSEVADLDDLIARCKKNREELITKQKDFVLDLESPQLFNTYNGEGNRRWCPNPARTVWNASASQASVLPLTLFSGGSANHSIMSDFENQAVMNLHKDGIIGDDWKTLLADIRQRFVILTRGLVMTSKQKANHTASTLTAKMSKAQKKALLLSLQEELSDDE